MKPPFTCTYDESGDVLYIHGADNRAAVSELHPVYADGCLLRFDPATGELVGVTLVGTQWKRDLRKPTV